MAERVINNYMSNKLGLTIEERTVYYTTSTSEKRIGEVRTFDPILGLTTIHDPLLNKQIDFIWDSDSSKWKGIGEQAGYIADVDFEVPITKQNDSAVPATAKTVSPFPT